MWLLDTREVVLRDISLKHESEFKKDSRSDHQVKTQNGSSTCF